MTNLTMRLLLRGEDMRVYLLEQSSSRKEIVPAFFAVSSEMRLRSQDFNIGSLSRCLLIRLQRPALSIDVLSKLRFPDYHPRYFEESPGF